LFQDKSAEGEVRQRV